VRKKTSKIWQMEEEEFKVLVSKSSSYTEILRFFKMCIHGNNSKTLKSRIDALDCSTAHFHPNFYNLVILRMASNIPYEKIFCENSRYSQKSLKRRIIKDKLLPYQCRCGNKGEWLGAALSLQLEHINGVNNDNRLENLEFLCPNCHTQTETFAGRNNPSRKPKKDPHAPKLARRRVTRPSREELEQLVWSTPTSTLAKQFGVSDVAIGKWCKTYDIKKPSRGYWEKQKT